VLAGAFRPQLAPHLHLVIDEQGPLAVADLPQGVEEALARRADPQIEGDRLDDDGRDRRFMIAETGAHVLDVVVVARDNGLPEEVARDAGAVHLLPHPFRRPGREIRVRPADPEFGGGGTVWGQMVYDPELDLVYCGTGNAAPYNAPRDWSGRPASNRLYAASIVAVHASTGQMAWYYQTTPGDVWDFDATANLVLASLRINGVERQVLMQANKNGFFYLIDRRSGRPVSAAPFAYMNWASGMDAGFRPIVDRAAADYNAAPKIVFPSVLGAHSWPPMSYNPQTGLVYVPSLETGTILADVTKNPGSRISWLDQQLGVTEIVPDKTLSYDYWESLVGKLPHFEAPSSKRSLLRGLLRAWDPLTRRVVWEQQTSEDYAVFDGGTMTTAGGLVFAGREDGTMMAYDARTGSILKTIQTGSAIMAAPMTFELGGRQYVITAVDSVLYAWALPAR